jgi:hypothetical protein
MLLYCVVEAVQNISSERPETRLKVDLRKNIITVTMPKGVYDRESLEDRLEKLSSRNENGCLIFTGHIDKDGYGQVSLKCKTLHVHRAVWIDKNGPIPEGMIVGHLCDDKYPTDSNENRKCFELSHLCLMTIKENIQRASALGRLKKTSGAFTAAKTSGENNVKAKLTGEIVLEIRNKLKDTQKYGNLALMAEEYGVQYQTLYKISKGILWNKPEFFP